MQGIDVSKWNGDIDWSKVKKAGVEFVLISCGTSQSSIDSFEKNYKGAKNNGIMVGVYRYSYAKT